MTTGTINPGVIWVGKYYQVGVEAMIPVNRQSGTGVGAIAQLHFFLDDIFPNTIGTAASSATASQQGGRRSATDHETFLHRHRRSSTSLLSRASAGARTCSITPARRSAVR